MAINQHHTFEDLDGVKCGIVEKNISEGRADFLRALLAFNGYTVVVVPAAPPKGAVAPAEGAAAPEAAAPASFTLGVTDVTFNATNAVFGRLLRTPEGHVVTRDYWQQRSSVSDDSVPYFSKK